MQEDKKICDICYEEMKNKVSLECKHELCLKCFMKIVDDNEFRCHMCRKKFELKENSKPSIEERVMTIVREIMEKEPMIHFEDIIRATYRYYYLRANSDYLFCHKMKKERMNSKVCYWCHYPLDREVKVDRNIEMCAICKKGKTWGKSKFITDIITELIEEDRYKPDDFDDQLLKFLNNKKQSTK